MKDRWAAMDPDRYLMFGNFRLDFAGERLWHGDEAVALTPKAFAVLRRLVEDGGFMVRVVDELVALRVLECEDGRWRVRGRSTSGPTGRG